MKNIPDIWNCQLIIPINMNSFLDRLNLVVQRRKKHPWGKSLGIPRGTVDNMFKGNIPTADTLSAISRAENVSLTWLLEGRGSPFMVSSPADDGEACDILAELLAEDGWSAYLLSHDDEHVIVLTQPATFQNKGKPEVQYTVVEIIAGQFGEKTLTTLKSAKILSRCHLPVSSDVIRRLRQGRMSNLELLGDNDIEGVLSECPKVTKGDTGIFPGGRVPALTLVQDKDDKKELYANVIKLSPEHRRVAEATVKALLNAEGKEWKDVY